MENSRKILKNKGKGSWKKIFAKNMKANFLQRKTARFSKLPWLKLRKQYRIIPYHKIKWLSWAVFIEF